MPNPGVRCLASGANNLEFQAPGGSDSPTTLALLQHTAALLLGWLHNSPWWAPHGPGIANYMMCITNNKNPETEIGVQPENQKSKAAEPLEKSYLYQGWETQGLTA